MILYIITKFFYIIANQEREPIKIGVFSRFQFLSIIFLISFSLISLGILYYSYTPINGGPSDLGDDYSFLTHTISKLGRLENQPQGTWILWCLSMISFGITFMILIQKLRMQMEIKRPVKEIDRFELRTRQLAWLCFTIGISAVIIVGFLPITNSNGVSTILPHKIIVSFMILNNLVIKWENRDQKPTY